MGHLQRTGTGMSLAPFGERGRARWLLALAGSVAWLLRWGGGGAVQGRSMTPGFQPSNLTLIVTPRALPWAGMRPGRWPS